MANFTWIGGSASWGTASDWSGAGTTTLPSMYDTVQIGVAGVTVTIGAGIAADAYTLTTQQSTLSLLGGSLHTFQNATFNGLFKESNVGSGTSLQVSTFTVGGFGVTFAAGIDFTSGVIQLAAGAVANISNGGFLGGTISGGGTLLISGGSTYLDTGFTDTTGSIIINGGKLGFNENFSSTNGFSLISGVADLFEHTLFLRGQGLLDATLGGGTVDIIGTTTVAGPGSNGVVFNNGLIVNVSGTLDQDNNVSFGDADAGAKATISKTGEYLINGNWNIGNPTSTGSITNLGLFAKTAGGRTAYIAPSFTSTGTISVEIGTLQFGGLIEQLHGTINGAGTLALSGAETILEAKLALSTSAVVQEGGVVVLNQGLTYGGEWDMVFGTLNLNTTKSTLTLTGHANLDGGLITGYDGELIIAGTAQLGSAQTPFSFGGPDRLLITGAVDQTNNINFGLSSNPIATIAAGAVWSIEGDSAISGFFGQINNNGLFIDPNGSGSAVVQPELISTGTLTVNNSTLILQGQDSLGGTLSGSGTLDIAGPTTLDKGVVITVAGLNIDNSTVTLLGNTGYGNVFTQTGYASVLNLNTETLTLSGIVSLEAGSVGGSGLLTTSGPTTISNYAVDPGVVLQVTGDAEQTGGLTLDFGTAGGELAIASGAIYTLNDDVSIGGGGIVVNQGTLVSTGTGTSDVIDADYVQSGARSLLQVDNQFLALQSGGSLAGTIAGAEGALVLAAGTFALNAGLNLTIASLEITGSTTITLTANQTYAGFFNDVSSGTIGLNSETLTLTGSTQLAGATLNGAGTLALSNAVADSTRIANDTLASGAVLQVNSTAEQFGQLYLGQSTLVVANHGDYLLHAGSTIAGNNGLVVVNAGGTLAAPDDRGTSQPQYSIGTAIVDNGMISAALGTLSIAASVTGTGGFSIGGTGAVLQFENYSSLTSTITATNSITFAAAGGDLVIANVPNFNAIIDGFGTGDVIELPGFQSTTASATLNGSDYTVTDKSGNSIVIDFGTKETSTGLTLGIASDGNLAIFHS